MFDFKKQNTIGASGEESFAAAWLSLGRAPLVRLDGRRADFKTTEGRLLEVKTETRSLAATPNFFMERRVISAGRGSKAGGPFRALQEGIQLYVVWFPKDATWWEFHDVAALCRATQTLAKETLAKLHVVRNEGYEGHGWALPRARLVELTGPTVFQYTAKQGE